MQIEFTPSEKDLLQFADYQVAHSPRVRAHIRRSRVAYLVSFLMLALGAYLASSERCSALSFAAISVALFLLSPLITRFRIRRDLQARYRDPANRLKYRKHTLRILDESLEDRSDEVISTVRWTAVVRVDRTPTHGFIYLASDAALVIPRDSAGPEAFDAFMAEAASKWKSAAA